jgi:hypothetical protein
MTEEEKSIARDLRSILRLHIRYSRAYTDKRMTNNIIRIKIWNWRSRNPLDDIGMYQNVVTIIREFEATRNAFFLKPIIKTVHSYSYGREYEVPCIFIYFNV